MAEAIAQAALPLVTSTPIIKASASVFSDCSDWITIGDLQVCGGIENTDWRLEGTILHIMTSKPLAVKNAEGKEKSATTIEIDAGVHSDLTLSGVNIETSWIPLNMTTNKWATESGSAATESAQIIPEKRTSLHLTLADGSENYLATTGDHAALRCGDGSVLVIDDAIRNIDIEGKEVTPEKGVISRDTTLMCGMQVRKGDGLSSLDSKNPGSLTVKGGQNGAGIGGCPREAGGTMTFNGGVITANNKTSYSSPGIGGGGNASGTRTLITFNGGNYHIYGGEHAAGTGAAGWSSAYGGTPTTPSDYILDTIPVKNVVPVGGDIHINGGYLVSEGGSHGSGFGGACGLPPSQAGCTITITGGTLLPKGAGDAGGIGGYILPDLGGHDGYVVIEGGSVYVSGQKNFVGIGDTAWGSADYTDENNKVFMVAIDLSKELKTNNEAAGLPDDTPLDNTIESWDLTIGGEHYDYGAPTRFDNGKLYLWLPKSAANKTISVTLEYKNADGSTQKVLPLYREPGQAGDLLKRYLDFQITDQGYLNSLNKYYDGLPLASYDLAAGPITTPPPDNKTLDRVADESGRSLIKYSYQPYDKKPSGPDDDSPRPIGPETSETVTDESGNEVTTLPANAGLAKFTMVSKQYADEESSDEDVRDFAKSYWGHRATGWLEIKPIASVVTDLTAEWADEAEGSDQRPGSTEHSADQVLKVSATIDRAKTVDGKAGSEATKPTCAAPEGRVQLYVDGEPVGSPIELLFEDKTVPDSPTRASRAVVPANAQRVDNGEGGSYTRFEYSFKPSETDYLVPEVGEVGRHEISLKFLPPSDDQRAEGVPANYLESADPTESPEVPRDTVAIDPIDPNPAVTGGKDPDCTDPDAPEPKVETSPGEPADPDADPDKPGDKVFRGSVTTTWGEASEANPHPGRVVLKVRTPSSGAIEVTDEKGSVFKAEFKKGDDGLPVKDNDGCYTLVIDPTAIGTGQLTFVQKPNGAYTGSTWIYSVTVRPDASVAPAPKLVKKAENLTHPNGPTQPGDRVRYTITASNGAAGSLWTQVVVSDPLPACLDVAGATVKLVGADGVERTLSAAAPGAAPAAGQYALAAAGADGRRVLEAPVGDIGGGRAAALSIECAVRGDIDFAAAANGSLSLENVAEATGKRPNPDDPDGPDVGPVDPDPSDPAAPPGPEEVLPADPDVRVGKTVENASDPGAKVTRVGDVLRYTVTLENAGVANSCLASAVISDPLPAGLEPVAGTLRLSVGDGEPVAVPDAAYNAASRTIAVAVGDLWGGDSATLTFQATVGEAALGSDIANVAFSHGRVPSQGAEELPEAPDPGKPTDPPAGEPVAKSDPASPAPVVGDDPEEGDVAIGKTAENTSRGDGTTHVGDTVRYELTLRNEGAGTSWMNAVIRDDVPEGLEPVSGTIRLRLPDGTEAAVDDAAYDPGSRVLAVAVGHLHGGQEAVLRFDALVTGAAAGADIGNVAVGYGAPPSAWDPDGESPEPGAPFDPPGGWNAWEEGRGKVVSDPAYPPGVDRLGGVMAGDLPGDKRRTTIAHKLAQTGDALAAAAGTALAGALAAAALALATRRRRRAQ